MMMQKQIYSVEHGNKEILRGSIIKSDVIHFRGLSFSSEGGVPKILGGHRCLERKIGGVIQFLMTKM